MSKKLRFIFMLTACVLLYLNVFAQTAAEPFRVSVSGKGKQAIVFIPGFACSGDVWTSTRAAFEQTHKCYTFTMAGFAGVPAQGSPSFRGWETAIAAYLKAKHIEHPVIVGHSMGGGLALALAADYPELASRVIVVDALPCLAALMNPSFHAKEPNDCSELIGQVKALSPERFTQMQEAATARLVADTSKRPLVLGWSMQSDRGTFGAIYCDFLNTDLRGTLAPISCPVLVLLEAPFKDYKETVAAQYKDLKDAQLVYADKGLHFIMYDDVSWYMDQLKGFIK